MHFKTTFAIKYVQIQFFYRKAQNVKYKRHIIIYNQTAAHYKDWRGANYNEK